MRFNLSLNKIPPLPGLSLAGRFLLGGVDRRFRRTFLLWDVLNNGEQANSVLKIRFDQGMSYWHIKFPPVWSNFNFNNDVTSQRQNMVKARLEGKVIIREENWSTDVVVEVMES